MRGVGSTTSVNGSGDGAIDWRIPLDEDRIDWRTKIRAASIPLYAVAALIAGQIFMAEVTTFRTYDAVLVIVAAILPAELSLAWFFFADHPLALVKALARAKKGTPFARLDRVAGVALIVLLMPAAAVLFVNQRLDRSPGVLRTLTIGKRWISHGRHGSQSCMVSVTADVRRPLRIGSFYGDAEAIRLPCAEWERVEVGHTGLALTISPGLLGFAWYSDPAVPAKTTREIYANQPL